MKPTKYGLSFGDNTMSVVFELSAPPANSPANAKDWLGHGSFHVRGADAASASAVAVQALRKMADDIEADDQPSVPAVAPSPSALTLASEMAAGYGAPPMTTADVNALAAAVDASAPVARPEVPCVDCGKPAVALRTTNGRMDATCAEHHAHA